MKKLISILLFFSLPTLGGTVIRKSDDGTLIAVSRFGEKHWQLNDIVCFHEGMETRACGPIVVLSASVAIVNVGGAGSTVTVGDTAYQEKSITEFRPVSLSSEESPNLERYSEVYTNRVKRLNFTLGADYATKTSFPTSLPFLVGFQYAAADKVAVGVEYLTATTPVNPESLSTVTALDQTQFSTSYSGPGLTLDYYSKGQFTGWWGHTAIDFVSATSTFNAVSGNQNGVLLSLLGGYRYGKTVTFGFAFGIQYLYLGTTDSLPYGYSGLMQAAHLNIGFAL